MRVPVLAGLLCACGGSSRHATTSGGQIALVPRVQSTAFYRSKASCAQGPFELELPVGAAKYGEQVELLVRTKHRIELHAVIVDDTTELASSEGMFGAEGRTNGRPDNARCRADAHERLAATRAGGGGATGGGTAGGNVPAAPHCPPRQPRQPRQPPPRPRARRATPRRAEPCRTRLPPSSIFP